MSAMDGPRVAPSGTRTRSSFPAVRTYSVPSCSAAFACYNEILDQKYVLCQVHLGRKFASWNVKKSKNAYVVEHIVRSYIRHEGEARGLVRENIPKASTALSPIRSTRCAILILHKHHQNSGERGSSSKDLRSGSRRVSKAHQSRSKESSEQSNETEDFSC